MFWVPFLAGVFVGVALGFMTVVAVDLGSGKTKKDRRERYEAERREVARELAAIVENARRNRLPMWVEPTRKVHGVIVHPMGGTTVFDEEGVPQ